MPRNAVERAVVAGALLIALALRLNRLGDANVWWDEALAVWAVRDTLAGVTAWTATDVHPPIFFWQLWAWVRLVGESEYASRAATALTGVLVVAVSYALGRRVAGAVGGVVAALLTAIAPLLVWWSMELRMYMLAGLFVAVAVWCGLAWSVERRWAPARPKPWGLLPTSSRPRRHDITLIGYAVAAWAALHTVYLAGVAVAVIAAAILVTVRADRRRAVAWLSANVAVAVLTLPWLVYAVHGMSSWTSITTPPTFGFVTHLWATLASTGRSTDIEAALVPTIAFWLTVGLAVIAGRWRAARARPRRGLLVLAVFVLVPPLAVWAITQPRSIFYSPGIQARYFVPFAAPALCFVAAAVASAWRAFRPVGLVATLVVMVMPLWSLPAHYAERRWHDAPAAMAAAIWSQSRPGDVVVLVSGDRYPLWRHVYDRRAPPGSARSGEGDVVFGAPAPGTLAAPADRPDVVEMPAPGGGPLADYDWQPRMERLLAAHDRVWLVEIERQLQDPDGLLEKWLVDRRPRVLSESYGPDSVHLFAIDDAGPTATLDAGTHALAGTTHIFWVAPPASVAMPGDQVNITLAGRRPASMVLGLADHSVGIGGHDCPLCAGPSYATVAFGERGGRPPPPRAPQRYRAALNVTERLPAGRYAVRLETAGAPIAHLDVRGTLPPVPLADTDFGFHAPLDRAGLRSGWNASVERPWGFPDLRLTNIGVGGATGPGGRMVVDLMWQRQSLGGASDEAPMVFVHLLGPVRADGGIVWAGDDSPASGGWPERLEGTFDRHVLQLPPDLPAGEYSLEVGMYSPSSGERYSVDEAESAGVVHADPAAKRVVVDGVTVRPPSFMSSAVRKLR